MQKRAVMITGTAVLVVAGGGVAAAAAYASPSPSASPPAGAAPGRPFAGGGPPVPIGPGFDGRMLHGESVGKNDKGAIVTYDWQRGDVTAASGSSVTVRSEDGAAWTWTLNKDTNLIGESRTTLSASEIKAGDKVMVSGTRSGGTRTAVSLVDPPLDPRNLRKNLPHPPGDPHKRMPRFWRHGPEGGPWATKTPAPSTTPG